MIAFLTAKSLFGFTRWVVWLAGAAVLAGLAWIVVEVIDNTFEDVIETAERAGATEAVVAGQATTLEQVGAAHEAGNEVRNDRGNARYDQCLLDATDDTRANCERFAKQPVPGDARTASERGPGGGR
ncbi:MAG: hypothetical protein B7Y88_14225 [Sphingomonadales bacterium 32-64-17]|nr:MAG: hypothetical protein B7Y88_14225 [Sphingomonadales bacterium 32-64-17]